MENKKLGGSMLCRRASLISLLLLLMLGCTNARTSSPTPPPDESNRNEPLLAINYDRPGDPNSQSSVNGRADTLTSKLMGRDMPYNVVLPADYRTNTTSRYPVVYLLHGLMGHYNDWTDRTKLVQIASKHSFIIVTPEGNDGWYSDNPTVPKDKYESYIIRELIPEIDKRFRTVADREHRAIAGLSMGGYGAIKFGLKYPEMFTLVGSFSGAFAIHQWSENVSGIKLIAKSVDVVFGPLNSPARKANDIFRLTRDLSADKVKALPYIYMSCGTEDSMIKNNNEYEALLKEKMVDHEYNPKPGVHDWVFWGGQVIDFLDLAERRLKK